jgi:hypothetical protein
MPGVLAVIGLVLLYLAGLNVGSPRFSLGWFGLGFIALAALWAPVVALAG